MKNFKIFALAAAAMILGLTSCSKDNNPEEAKADFKVNIRFNNVASRASGTAAAAADEVGVTNGYLIFASSANVAVDVFTIKAGANASNDREIESTTLVSTGAECLNVPGASTQVYLIANLDASVAAPAAGANMATYLATLVNVEHQGNHTAVLATGKATLMTTAVESEKTASIVLGTNVARIQIKGITFGPTVDATVEGIYINGYAPTMTLNGAASALVSSTTAADYVSGSATFPTPLSSYVFDAGIAQTITGGGVAAPAPAGNVWGYNLFAAATPQIIIKLSNVSVSGVALSGDQFITIDGFKNGGTIVPTLAGGMIYTIETIALAIDGGSIAPQPGVKPLKVNVDVTTVTWDETVVTPNL